MLFESYHPGSSWDRAKRKLAKKAQHVGTLRPEDQEPDEERARAAQSAGLSDEDHEQDGDEHEPLRFVNTAEGFARNIARPSYVCALSWGTLPPCSRSGIGTCWHRVLEWP